MCLITEQYKVKNTDSEMLCLKVVMRKGDEYVTPYQHADISEEVKNGGVITAKGSANTRHIREYTDGKPKTVVERGYIHGFSLDPTGAYFASSMADINSTGWRVDEGWEPRILLCSVAEGTPYYAEEEWERSHHAMAARSMRVIRDVTEDTYHRMRGMIAPFWAADINSVVYDRLKEGIEKIIAETERDKVGTNKG